MKAIINKVREEIGFEIGFHKRNPEVAFSITILMLSLVWMFMAR